MDLNRSIQIHTNHEYIKSIKKTDHTKNKKYKRNKWYYNYPSALKGSLTKLDQLTVVEKMGELETSTFSDSSVARYWRLGGL